MSAMAMDLFDRVAAEAAIQRARDGTRAVEVTTRGVPLLVAPTDTVDSLYTEWVEAVDVMEQCNADLMAGAT